MCKWIKIIYLYSNTFSVNLLLDKWSKYINGAVVLKWWVRTQSLAVELFSVGCECVKKYMTKYEAKINTFTCKFSRSSIKSHGKLSVLLFTLMTESHIIFECL